MLLRSEIAFAERGTRWAWEREDGTTIDDVSRVRYIEVPLNLGVVLPEIWVLQPLAYAGVVPAFYLGARKTVKEDEREILVETRNRGARNLDVGIDIGGGLRARAGKGIACIEVRYTRGLLTVDADGESGARNRVVGVSIGYGVPIGQRSP